MALLEGIDEVRRFIEEKKVRYFKSEEFVCKCGCGRVLIDSRLILLLDALRDYLKKPVVITSAYRCPSHNRTVGGVSNSEHVHGLAVDIACTSSRDRYDIVKFAMGNGIERIGIAKNFVHLGLDEEKPHPVLWHYYHRK
ncbi:MAG: peptidase M15 [Thermotogae bacterium]|nr:peptidase M15 [Thermotogota bacterium]